MEFKILRCPYCGNEGHLEHKGEIWYCAYCNNSCTDNSAERAFIKLGEKLEANLTSQIQGIVDAAFMKKREEEYFNLRSLLWEKTHAKYIDSSAIISVCRDIKKLEPHDFLANFYDEKMDIEQIRAAYKNIFKTETGKKLCHDLYGV